MVSPEIASATLHVAVPWQKHVYGYPFLSLYPLLAYAYFVKYDEWFVSEEWTFLACVTLGAGHALSFLVTKWNTGARAWITTRKVCINLRSFRLFYINLHVKASSLEGADCIRIVPQQHKGQGDIVKIDKKDPSQPSTWTFNYQRDIYSVTSTSPVTFGRLPYPSTRKLSLSTFLKNRGLSSKEIPALQRLYGDNEFDIPIPSFTELFSEHATAPFFVFQIFCVALWCLDEYWYYSLFTLFMLIVFECTVVWQVSCQLLYNHSKSNFVEACSNFDRVQNHVGRTISNPMLP